MKISSTLKVDLGERSYPIVIGSGLLGNFDLCDYFNGPDCLVVTNETVGPLYLPALQKKLPPDSVVIALPDGEQHKTLKNAERVLDELVASHANRDATVVALGGGVIGDIAGFAAACYMRGIAFIQVPTTLLAQVDSSVGGKTGVNHKKGKNLIGAFHQPKLVLIDTDTLSTLPDRQLKAGLAEVIKYGAIADIDFLGWLEANIGELLDKNPDALVYAILRSCELKAGVVADDEREAGRRAILNFGHTFGHAIENSLGYGEWLHGEAIAAGMLMAVELSNIGEGASGRLRNLLEAAGLPVCPPAIGAEKMRAAMEMDKKVQANQSRFVLLRSLGDAYLTPDYDAGLLNSILLKCNS
ncbi:MAG: 3-dehydroquinate synthase [Gammaproteobacteria bacterium]|nr:MAG: 3-dehydroquinate synthase [Gammaproteobacteria bacterium]